VVQVLQIGGTGGAGHGDTVLNMSMLLRRRCHRMYHGGAGTIGAMTCLWVLVACYRLHRYIVVTQ